MRRFFAVGLLIAAATVGAPADALAAGHPDGAHASAATDFLSPDGAIWCSATATEVGCVSRPGTNADGAVVNRRGKVTLCHVGSAGPAWKCFQNFDETAPVLHYGRRVEVGAFTCTSKRAGITCTVRPGGRGFRIDRQGVVAIR
jgi:hypothetical protein